MINREPDHRCDHCSELKERGVAAIVIPNFGVARICEQCLRTALQLCFPAEGFRGVPVARPFVESDPSLDTREAAIKTCDAFLALNGIASPTYEFKGGIATGGLHGHYKRATQTVTVYEDLCHVGGTASAAPGFWDDFSVLGVTAHEVGHHVENSKGWKKTTLSIYDSWMKEGPLTGYAQFDRHEYFAEALMLLITNPDLLRTLCPVRYAFMTEKVGLKVPTAARPWRDVLRGHDKCVEMVEERIR